MTAETTPIPFASTEEGNRDLPLGEPEPIIVGTALMALYENGPADAGPLGEPEPIIVGTALMAFYERAPADPEPLGEPEPIIVGTVLMAFDEKGEGNKDALGKGVASFEQAVDIGGVAVVDAKEFSLRFLWRTGDFWADRDFMIIFASTHPR